jgi:hypothetical protein
MPTVTAPLTRPQMVALVRHECGHAVIGKACGFTPEDLYVRRTQPGLGVDLRPALASTGDFHDYASRRIKTLFAGALAQTLDKGVIDDGAARNLLAQAGTAENDAGKIRELARVVVGFKNSSATPEQFDSEMNALLQGLFHEAAEMVVANAQLIEDLATFCLGKINVTLARNQARNRPFVLGAEINSFIEAA